MATEKSVIQNYLDCINELDDVDIQNYVSKADSLFGNIDDLTSLELDARLLSNIVKKFEVYTSKNPIFENDNDYNQELWTTNLLNKLKLNPDNLDEFWNNLGNNVLEINPFILPSYSHLFGTNLLKLNTNVNVSSQSLVEKKARTNYCADRIKDKNVIKRPEKVSVSKCLATTTNRQQMQQSGGENGDEGYVPEVEIMYNRIREYCEAKLNCTDPCPDTDEGAETAPLYIWTVPFWPVVLRADSYDATMINIFYVSLLLKDGHAILCPKPMEMEDGTDVMGCEEGVIYGEWPKLRISPTSEQQSFLDSQMDLEGNVDENGEETLHTNIELTYDQWEMLSKRIKPLFKNED